MDMYLPFRNAHMEQVIDVRSSQTRTLHSKNLSSPGGPFTNIDYF